MKFSSSTTTTATATTAVMIMMFQLLWGGQQPRFAVIVRAFTTVAIKKSTSSTVTATVASVFSVILSSPLPVVAVDDVDVSAMQTQTQEVDSLIDQLADFKSFGASLMTSTNSLAVATAAAASSESLTASGGSGAAGG